MIKKSIIVWCDHTVWVSPCPPLTLPLNSTPTYNTRTTQYKIEYTCRSGKIRDTAHSEQTTLPTPPRFPTRPNLHNTWKTIWVLKIFTPQKRSSLVLQKPAFCIYFRFLKTYKKSGKKRQKELDVQKIYYLPEHFDRLDQLSCYLEPEIRYILIGVWASLNPKIIVSGWNRLNISFR